MTIYPRILLAKNDGKYDWYEVVEDCAVGPLLIVAGFTTDFASVPQLVWSLIPPHGRSAMPSIVHDYMYQVPNSHCLTRKQVDGHWLELLKKAGVPKWQRLTMYALVRAFGSVVWKRYRTSNLKRGGRIPL